MRLAAVILPDLGTGPDVPIVVSHWFVARGGRVWEGERLVENGQPVIRQFRTSENLILKDGQTSDNILSTDPINGHVIRVSVTINVQK